MWPRTLSALKTRVLTCTVDGTAKSGNIVLYCVVRGPGNSVGIATDYGLDGPGSNPSGDEIFRLSRLALGPTQPPVKRVTGLSRW